MKKLIFILFKVLANIIYVIVERKISKRKHFNIKTEQDRINIMRMKTKKNIHMVLLGTKNIACYLLLFMIKKQLTKQF